jgi:hypothetical protein
MDTPAWRQTVGSDVVTPNVKMLGTPLLAFVLGLTDAEARKLLDAGGELIPTQISVLRHLHELIEQVKGQRVANQSLEHIDLMFIGRLRSPDGSHVFNKLRSAFVGQSAIPSTGDGLCDLLAQFAADRYPQFLVERSFQGQKFGLLPFSSLGDSLGTKLVDALAADPVLSRLFPTSDPFNATSMVHSSSGRGGTLQLALMPEFLLKSAYDTMRSQNLDGVENLIVSLKSVLDIVRSAVRGDGCKIPAILVFDGIQMSNDAEIALERDYFGAVSPGLLELLPGEVRPTIYNNMQTGAVLRTQLNYTIKISSWNPSDQNPAPTWPISLDDLTSLNRKAEQLSLTMALCVDQPSIATAVHRCTLVLDPLFPSGLSWKPKRYGNVAITKVPIGDYPRIGEWNKVLEGAKDEPIRIAIRRLLSALAERDNPADSFVDAIIALENLFGERSEVGLSVAASVARLIEMEVSSRQKRFEHVKKFMESVVRYFMDRVYLQMRFLLGAMRPWDCSSNVSGIFISTGLIY